MMVVVLTRRPQQTKICTIILITNTSFQIIVVFNFKLNHSNEDDNDLSASSKLHNCRLIQLGPLSVLSFHK